MKRRSSAEVETDLIRAMNVNGNAQPTEQNVFYQQPYGDKLKALMITDFRIELMFARNGE